MTVLAALSPLEAVLETTSAELERWHVPGLELAVLRDGEPLFSDGLGVRGVADPTPVAATTLFHHGSCGKAYTGLLAAVLAEEGVVDLDAPVRRYVPELRLPDPVLADRITIRDLVSHRSGLGRHDMAWICNPSWSREELVRRLEHLPLVGDLRNQLHYSNFGYTLAGLALGRAAGSTWEEQLRVRVLDPLGMRRTFAATPEVVSDPDHAVPHLVRDGKPVETSFRIMQGIGPAGEILSCAQDSVTWLSAQLGAEPGVSTSAIAVAQQPQMLADPGMAPFPEMEFIAYAMGWLVGSYRGHKLVWHNGGIDGFTTQTLLLPGRGIGIVACANQHMTNFPLAVMLAVADAALGVEPGEQDWFERLRPAAADVPKQQSPATPAAPAAHSLADYAGHYRNAGYGDVVVAVDEQRLAVRIGEFDVAVKHRHYETWDLRYEPLDAGFPATFLTGADGNVTAVVVDYDTDMSVRFERVTGE
jgi:CubicO group peptidase (beta-lactamase class C family)